MYQKYKKNEKKYINIINNMVKKDNVKKFTIIQLGNGDNGEERKPPKIVRLNLGPPTNLFGTQNNEEESSPPRIVRLRRSNFGESSSGVSTNLFGTQSNESAGDSTVYIPKIKRRRRGLFPKTNPRDESLVPSKEIVHETPIFDEKETKFINIIKLYENIIDNSLIQKTSGTNKKTFIVRNNVIKFFEIEEFEYLQRVLKKMPNKHPTIISSIKINILGKKYYYVKMNKYGVSAKEKLNNLLVAKEYSKWVSLREAINGTVKTLIQQLHNNGLYHGDLVMSNGSINDGNILVNEDEDTFEFKFIDFGIDLDEDTTEELKIKNENVGKILIDDYYSRKIKKIDRILNPPTRINHSLDLDLL